MSKSIGFVSVSVTHTGCFSIYRFDRDRSETDWEVRISRDQAEALRDRLTELLASAASLSSIGGGQ